MTIEDRIKKIKSAHNRVVKAVNELRNLNCSYSDSASDIVLFDDTLTEYESYDRQIGSLSSNYIDVDKITESTG